MRTIVIAIIIITIITINIIQYQHVHIYAYTYIHMYIYIFTYMYRYMQACTCFEICWVSPGCVCVCADFHTCPAGFLVQGLWGLWDPSPGDRQRLDLPLVSREWRNGV